MSGVVVRRVRGDDVEGLAEVHSEAWSAAYGGLFPPGVVAERFGREQRRLLWRGLLEDPLRFPMVDVAAEASAQGGERLHGFVWCRLTGQSGAAFDAEVVALNVAPGQWRRGIGRGLLAAAASRLAAAGAGSVYLWVFEENGNARAFYDALGGRIVDRGSENLGGIALPTLAYGWKPLFLLSDAAAS